MCVRRGWPTKAQKKKPNKREILLTLALLSTHVSYEQFRAVMRLAVVK